MHKKKKGSALFVAIMISFIGLILIAGLVALWSKFTRITFPIKTYSSVREAAAGGIKLLKTYIDSGYFDDMRYGECPSGTTLCPSQEYPCCKVILKYKLVGNNALHDNIIFVNFLGSSDLPGYVLGGVVGGGQSNPVYNYIYGFNSTATARYGSNNVTAYIEAVYLRIAK